MARTTTPISHEYLAKLKKLADMHKRSQTMELEHIIDQALGIAEMHKPQVITK